MITLQGIDKLQHCFENSSLAGARNHVEIDTFSIDIEIKEDISMNTEISALIRSSSLTRCNRLSISSTRPNKHIGRRGFAVAAPAEWNKLPQTVRSQQTIDGFRSQLKTYLFRLAYPPP